MEQFKITEEGCKKLAGKWLALTILYMALYGVMVAFLFSPIYINGVRAEKVSYYIAPFIFLIFSLKIPKAFRRNRQLLQSYSITISDNWIKREQLDTPSLTIDHTEIKEATKTEKGSYQVRGLTRYEVIHIPRWIGNPADLEKRLQALGTNITQKKTTVSSLLKIPLIVLVYVMLLAVAALDNKIIVVLCGIPVTASLLWLSIEMRRSKNLPEYARNQRYFYLALAFIVAYLVFTKLTGIMLFKH
ncbi:hypothetical protein ACQ86N_00530 [Puia sp. P3]|uniref:hypothetical protein n=1 Tax=Puia sp. P3 TaxID=3423952 RepID=UPI003D672894